MVPAPGGVEDEQVTQRHMLRHACGHLPNNRQAPEGLFAAPIWFCQVHCQEPSPDCSGLKHSPIPKLRQGLDNYPQPHIQESTRVRVCSTVTRVSEVHRCAVLKMAHSCHQARAPTILDEKSISYRNLRDVLQKKKKGIKRQVVPTGIVWKSRGPSSLSWSQASSRFHPEPFLQLAQHSGKSLLSKLEKSDSTLRKKHSRELLSGEATKIVHGKDFPWQLHKNHHDPYQHRERLKALPKSTAAFHQSARRNFKAFRKTKVCYKAEASAFPFKASVSNSDAKEQLKQLQHLVWSDTERTH